MHTFTDTTITSAIARQRRTELESVASRHRLARAARRDTRRRSRDPGPAPVIRMPLAADRTSESTVAAKVA
jgi:hypothetical protein